MEFAATMSVCYNVIMEYLVGAIATFICLFLFSIIAKKEIAKTKPLRIQKTQSYSYEIIRPVVPLIQMLKTFQEDKLTTQASKHSEKNTIKVLQVGNAVYWIAKNSLYTANYSNGRINEESTKIVDTMALDAVQLEKIIYIVDTLTKEDPNDSSNPRDKEF